MLRVGLAAAWGGVVATVLLRSVGRGALRRRARALQGRSRRARRRRARGLGGIRRAAATAARAGGPATRVVRGLRRRRRRRRRDEASARALPVVVDLLAVASGAGCAPYQSVGVAVRWAPTPVAAPLAEALRATDLGAGFGAALRELGRSQPVLRPLTDVVSRSVRLGSPIGPALRRLAAETRADLRRRAEARARRVPVRLLFPLVFLVLPAFALLTVVPALLAGFRR